MCDDTGLSRRRFLSAGAAAVLAPGGLRAPSRHAVLRGEIPARLPLRSRARPADPSGNPAYSMAMHIHSSFSEQTGSMAAQLTQAATNSVDVLWWTDHDHRMTGTDFRQAVHFTGLAEKGQPGQGANWRWVRQQAGPLSASSAGAIVTSPASPLDPLPHGSLSLAAQSTTPGTAATLGYYADSQNAGYNDRDNLTGQTLRADVLLEPGWSAGYFELAVQASYHPASPGRPAGTCALSYRITPGGTAGSVAQGNLGVVTIPATPGSWQTVTVTPAADIAALWPDLDSRDFALWELRLNAVSTGDLASGYFSYLRFERALSGGELWNQQAAMMAALAPSYPSVTQQQGTEVSWQVPHANWFGPQVILPGYGGVTPAAYGSYLAQTIIPQAHDLGALVCLNHPFGYTTPGTPLPQSQQDAMLASLASSLLASSPAPFYGCDMIEAGYPLRAGVDVAHHLALWDVASRNAIFLTGNGTSDDHFGVNWAGLANNWVTSAWAASASLGDLMAALAAGRCWCGSLAAFPLAAGSFLDLLADGSVPMGKVSVSGVTTRTLQILVAGIPAGGSVTVLRGAVDYAGQNGLSSNAVAIGSFPAAAFATGSVSLPVDTSTDGYYRVIVLDQNGVTVAAGNPVWLLQNPPPGGIPPARET